MSGEPAASLSRIAIVGMAGRFPGAPDIASFWRNLRDGVESVAFFTDAELIAAGVPAAVLRDPSYVKARAVLDEVDRFDAGFFELTPREAELLDPQHRVFLECAWHALEDAGYDPARIEGPVGVFAGVGSSGYLRDLDPRALEDGGAAAVALGNDRDFFATRISYKLNLSGPSLTIQTACSTSLVAVHLACQALLTAQCDMALAGGVCIKLPQQAGHVYQQGGIFTRDGHCRPFDAGATGTIGGSGLGTVVLKRLEDALADGDHIYALILASAVNNDGAAKVGYTAPSVDGQAEAIALAHALADIDAETIGFVEGHGTGTPLGDPIEIAALTKAFRISTRARAFCALGSVKSNVGHLDAAAGVAGLIKAVLALHHAEIPPTLHFDAPNPASTLADSPFYVNARVMPWPSGSSPRRAGVSSFGIGGTNAHLVLEQAPVRQPSAAAQPWQAITLSARSAAALDEATAQLAAVLPHHHADALADVAFTAQRGRRAFDHRRVIVARDVEDLLAAVSSADPARVFTGRCAAGDRPVAFLFPGQGAQQIDMGRALYESDGRFRQDVDECATRLLPHLGLDLRGVLYPAPEARAQAARQLDDTWLTQPALFTIEYALARLWMRWGVRPRALIGHSIGEYVAACLADVMSLADALALIAARGKLVQSLPAGAMLALSMAVDDLGDLLDTGVSVAAVNSPRWLVVSGTEAAVAEVERRVAARQITSVRLRTARAFHSAMLDPILAPFEALVATIQLRPPRVPIVSNVTGTWLTADEATAPRYWVRHMREPVRFADGVGALLDEPARVLLEVGPGRTLSNLVREHSQCDRDRAVIASQPGNATESDAAQEATTAAGRLWLAGVDVDWIGVHGGAHRQRVSLPGYPFERQRHWLAATAVGSREQSRPAPIAASDHDLYLPTWTQVPSVARTSTTSPHGPVLLFVDAHDTGVGLARRLAADGRRAIIVTPASAFSHPSPDAYTVAPTAASHEQLCAALDRGGAWPAQIVHLRSLSASGGSSSLDEALARGFESVLLLAQALAPSARAPIDLTLVSNGAYEVIGTEPLHPEAATLVGPLRVIPRELPHLRCRHIDLGGADLDDETIDAIGFEIAHPIDADVVALRNGLRWRQGFAKAPATDAPGPLRQGGTYAITGGLGGVGLSLARWLIEMVHARVALLGREGLPPRAEWPERLADTSSGSAQTIARRIRGVQALEAMGAETLVLATDCLDREQMTQAIAAVTERFGALHGVIHAAGLPGGGLVALKTIGTARRVMAPKLEGTRVLAEVLSGLDLDVVVLCSSLAGCLGGVGQVDYAAANAFLDAFAQSRRRERAPLTIAIDWGAWRDVGMAADARAAGTPRATPDTGEASGLSYAEATDAFARALALGAPRVAVSALPLDRWPLADPEPVAIAPPVDPSRGAHRHPRPDLPVARIDPRSETEAALAEIWQDVLGIEGIGVADEFSALGGHSLLATQIVARVRRQFGVDLPLRALFETPTVAALAAALVGKLATQSQQAEVEALLSRLEALPDAELAHELTCTPASPTGGEGVR